MLDKNFFQELIDGKQTDLYYLHNGKGMQVEITNYGARIAALLVPDAQGRLTDVVVGFDSLTGYLSSSEPFHGTIVGRFANRIARGRFTLNSKSYQLSINNGVNHLHGGPKGFHNQVWSAGDATGNKLSLSYDSPDGEENYPGNLSVNLQYELTEENELVITYTAKTDAPTVINLTSHPFFNLNGQGRGTIENHNLFIDADRYTPVDETLIPTGIEPVEDTPFDFREPRKIGSQINKQNDQLKYGGGYDHNYVLNGDGYQLAASAKGDVSGIIMEVYTDQPGIQLYTGNFMKSENVIKYGLTDDRRGAFCLETQHFPDSPNQPSFPSTVLEPGEVFHSRTVYKFKT